MNKKTILFAPVNSPGHMSSSVTLADYLRDHYGHRTVFLIIGDPYGISIADRGHELFILPEKNPFEDYEISDSDYENGRQVDDLELARRGKKKKLFTGGHKFNQFVMRFRMDSTGRDPLDTMMTNFPKFMDILAKDLNDSKEEVSAALAQIKPDLVIADCFFLPAPILDAGIPWVKLHSANPLGLVVSALPNGAKPTPMCGYSLMTKQERERLRNDEPDKWQALVEKWLIEAGKMEKVMRDIKGRPLEKFIGGRNPMDLRESKHLTIYLYPKSLDFDQEDDIIRYPARVFRCESLINPRSSKSNDEKNSIWAEKLAEKAKGREGIIYFSLGTIASGDVRLMKRFIGMLKQDPKRVYVISKGINGDKFELDGDNLLGANYLPQAFFLQNVDLVIIHGGNNTITECMHFGLPMIVLPCFADQFDNAQRVEDLGFGKRLELNVSQDELLATIGSVLSDTKLISKCKQVARSSAPMMDDRERVCLLLDKLANKVELDDETIAFCNADKTPEQIKAKLELSSRS